MFRLLSPTPAFKVCDVSDFFSLQEGPPWPPSPPSRPDPGPTGLAPAPLTVTERVFTVGVVRRSQAVRLGDWIVEVNGLRDVEQITMECQRDQADLGALVVSLLL